MVSVNTHHPTRLFLSLSLTTAFLTLGLIIFGAVVRVTDSGLGCGNHWPLCNGTIFPPLDNLTAWIEWLHRLFALLIGLFGLATLVVAWHSYRQQDNVVLGFTAGAAVLFAVQSGLGAIVVVFDLPPTFVTLHLGTAMLLLGALLVAAVTARYQPRQIARDSVTTLVYMNALFSLLIILTGALVRGSGATLACIQWPLCVDNSLLPLEYGQLAVIHMLHRFAVAALGITLGLLVWQVMRTRQDSFVRLLAGLALLTYGLQAGIGALYVLSVAAPIWGAAHVGMAATNWGILVILSTVEAMNTGQLFKNKHITGGTWNPQSEAI